MMEIGLIHYLVVSAIVFSVGFAIVAGRRNAIVVLMGLELILNAAGLNFVAFSRYVMTDLDGQVVTIFIIMLAAAEAAVALGIVLNIFTNFRTINVDEADLLKE
jgi:NADH-quinone oxidoreductase subunit K